MRAFERMEGESDKAYRAFQTFRDLGPDRSLAKAAQLVYGSTSNVRQMSRWSARFSWIERASAYDDWGAMIAREAVQRHIEVQAEDHAAREAALREKALEVREEAMGQAEKMIQWPLTEQRVLQESEGSEQVVYQFFPARWSKSTAVQLFNMALGNAPAESGEEEVADLDFSQLSDEELYEYVRLTGKLGLSPKLPQD